MGNATVVSSASFANLYRGIKPNFFAGKPFGKHAQLDRIVIRHRDTENCFYNV